jgi:LemA protein
MKKSTKIILAIVAFLILWGFVAYNGLVTANENVSNQWAQVETQYQRRFDLIGNLVNSVKGAMGQEQEVFTAIADARTRYSGATTVDQKVEAASQVEGALGRLLVITENYPQLASISTVQGLMAELTGTENRVSVERKRFNDTVRDYNLRTKQFPGMIFAKLFGFGDRPYFESAAGAELAPKVEF